MAPYLFARIPVSNYSAALAWYAQLLGSEPAFFPTETEAAWELGDHRYLYIEQRSDRLGQALVTVLVDELDDHVSRIALRGIEPSRHETYENGVRKVIYHDADGNEVGFGQSPD